MQPFRYCAEWIIAKPEDIIVDRFIGWRRAGKQRLFQPCALLKVGQYDIILDGKTAVWNLIDAVQPNMPRAVVTQGMKGEFIHEQPFAQDLQDFIHETDSDYVVFNCEYVTMREPNTTSLFVGHSSTQIKAHKSPTCILSAPKSWGESATLYLPMRVREGLKWLPAFIVGDFPRITIAQSLSESKSFDLESQILISSIVCNPAEVADIRPHATIKRKDPPTIISTIADMHHQLCDSDYDPSVSAQTVHKGVTGLRFAEIDDIEHSRALRLFISLP